MADDPYSVLGIDPGASDAELRSAYRRLAQLHHPDHNQGSPASALRFEQIQAAYASALELRRVSAGSRPQASGTTGGPDASIDARIAALEEELRRARQRTRAPAPEPPPRATPEELGYVTTDDSLSKILDDAGAELGTRLSRSSLGRRLADLLGSEGD